ncbi:MAG: DUF2169 domain-containing protein [Deltaproteobacteria bacterium]|nr:DUF2169 domain-containing protein [Deltaproteobacteria bacterium]
MGHPAIENRTPWAFEALCTTDADGWPVLVPLIQATFLVGPGGLSPAEVQPPIDLAGSSHGDPGHSSLKREPETAYWKPGTDVILLGHAHAPGPKITEMEVALRVGKLAARAKVVGDRKWVKGLTDPTPSKPLPIETVPLIYERAYGGLDQRHADPKRHGEEPRNPVGRGYHAKGSAFEEGEPLPNLEHPEAPVKSYWGKSTPVGFGFVAPHWSPRRELAGTYDKTWEEERFPRLPEDFSEDFFRAASPGLSSPVHLRGDEGVLAEGVVPEGRWAFELPGLAPPQVIVARKLGAPEVLGTVLGSLILDADQKTVTLVFRTRTRLATGMHDLAAMRIEPYGGAAPPPLPENVKPLAPRAKRRR